MRSGSNQVECSKTRTGEWYTAKYAAEMRSSGSMRSRPSTNWLRPACCRRRAEASSYTLTTSMLTSRTHERRARRSTRNPLTRSTASANTERVIPRVTAGGSRLLSGRRSAPRSVVARSRAGVHDEVSYAVTFVMRDSVMVARVPVQYFQSVITIELAVAGALLWQIRYFEARDTARPHGEKVPDARLRLGLAVVLGATILGSLWAMADEGPKWAALAVTVGLAVSAVPVLLRALPVRDAATQRDPHFGTTMVGLVAYAAIVAFFLVLLDLE